MTTEDLMKPRIKCIAPFLGIERSGWQAGLISQFGEIDDYLFTMSLPKRYPANFKSLFWWEDRDENDLPKYIRVVDENMIVKVEEYIKNVGFTFFFEGEYDISRKVFSNNTLPATEAEYEAYLNPTQ